jgi:hypothetical protein
VPARKDQQRGPGQQRRADQQDRHAERDRPGLPGGAAALLGSSPESVEQLHAARQGEQRADAGPGVEGAGDWCQERQDGEEHGREGERGAGTPDRADPRPPLLDTAAEPVPNAVAGTR